MFVNVVDVSVIIPVHNRANMIGDAVRSALTQDTNAALEIIVVDDGSTDGSGEVAAAIDPRVKVVRHETARGPGAARNTGLATAKGEYIAFLDSDDGFTNNHISSALAFLNAHPEVILCASGTLLNGSPVFMLSSAAIAPVVWTSPMRSLLITGNPLHTSTIVARAEVLYKCNGFDESLFCTQDYDLLFRLTEYGAFAHLTEVGAWRRISPNGQMTNRLARLNPAVVYARAFRKANLSSEDRKLAQPMFVNYVRMRLAQLVREKQGKAIWNDITNFRDALAWPERMIWRMAALVLWPFSRAIATSRP